MSFQISVSIGYRDIFGDYDTVDIKELIKDIPTKNALEIISYFLAQLHTLERDPTKQIEFLKLWLGRLPVSVHKRINDFITKILANPKADYNFLNNASGLILEEILIENSNDLELVGDLTPEQELNLFKGYLVCSQQWIDKQLPGFNIPKVESEVDLIKLILPTQLPFQEILEFKDFRLQFIKAIYFFKFCEKNEQFKIYLEIFLKEYNLESWQKYLMNLVTLYIRKFERMKTPSVINVADDFPDVINFLEDLSIDQKTFKKSDDFLGLREKPVYRINKNDFVFLNLNFLVDKLYQGIQFDFARVLVKNGATFKDKVIKSRVDFMSIFGNEFSETGLFYSVMDYAFEKSGYVKFNGEKIKAIIPDGEPDYYMRDKAKVYLFEFKNIFLGAGIKHCNNYDQIEAEIFKKLVTNQDNSAKGVTQLVNVIEKVRAKEFEKFDKYNFNDTIIYPIIVYVDFSFNLGGINFILNKEFRRQLSERAIKDTHKIKNLTLIDLDTFIKFQDLYRNKTLKLNNCLNEYFEYVKKPRDIFSRISTFNMFIHNKTIKIKYDSPKMLIDEVMKMLPTDEKELIALDKMSSE
jgi:hypothetical protein